jgi:hypothetical protein
MRQERNVRKMNLATIRLYGIGKHRNPLVAKEN